MPDIQMRFHQDMLVLSGRQDAVLARQGVDVERDREFLNLVEPDTVRDALRLESVAGAQCLVTGTAGITRARLAHARLEDRAPELVAAALAVVNSLKPQHVLYEVGPCGLPLDPSSAPSLKQSRDQYAQAVRDLEGRAVDAVLLSGFEKPLDLQCALMGVRKVSDVPVFACVRAERAADGAVVPHSGTWEELAGMLEEYGASVVGFSTGAPAEMAAAVVAELRAGAACRSWWSSKWAVATRASRTPRPRTRTSAPTSWWARPCACALRGRSSSARAAPARRRTPALLWRRRRASTLRRARGRHGG